MNIMAINKAPKRSCQVQLPFFRPCHRLRLQFGPKQKTSAGGKLPTGQGEILQLSRAASLEPEVLLLAPRY